MKKLDRFTVTDELYNNQFEIMVSYFFSRDHLDSVYYKHTNLHVPLVYLQPLDSRDQLSVLVTEKKI